MTYLIPNPPRIRGVNLECSYGRNFTRILNLIFFLHSSWWAWFFEYQKSKKYWLELFFLFRQKKVNLGNIFELNLKDNRSQRVYLWSEDTTVHCVQRSQYLKCHKETICVRKHWICVFWKVTKETICVWKLLAFVSFHDDIINTVWKGIPPGWAGQDNRRQAVC